MRSGSSSRLNADSPKLTECLFPLNYFLRVVKLTENIPFIIKFLLLLYSVCTSNADTLQTLHLAVLYMYNTYNTMSIEAGVEADFYTLGTCVSFASLRTMDSIGLLSASAFISSDAYQHIAFLVEWLYFVYYLSSFSLQTLRMFFHVSFNFTCYFILRWNKDDREEFLSPVKTISTLKMD